MIAKHRPQKPFWFAAVLFLLILFSMTVSAEAGWKKNANGTYSYYEDGEKVRNRWVGSSYYVNSRGVRQTGWLYKGKQWYFFTKSGKLVKKQWIKSGSKKYYAGSDGALYTSGRYKIGKYYYGFNKRGVMLLRRQKIGGKYYYFSPKTGRMVKSTWVCISKKYYYFTKNGAMARNQWVGRYYVGSSGTRLTSAWKDNKYLGSNGKAVSGLKKIKGTYYYFDPETYEKVTDTTVTVGGKTYSFDSSGKGTQISTNGAPATKESVENTYYTDKYVDDETLLAAIIYCEAGNQSYEGKLAVGYVIMNRVYDSRFPSKLREVIYQKTQFTPARNGALTRALSSSSLVTSECRKAAAEVMNQFKGHKSGEKEYLTIDGEKVTFPCIFFMTKNAYYSCGLSSSYVQIGAHVFFTVWKR